MRALILLALVALATAMPVTTSGRHAKCLMKPKPWPVPAKDVIETRIINLDLAPQDRWTEVVTDKAADIKNMIDSVFDMLPQHIVEPLVKRIDAKADEILNGFPAPYGDELRGIAKASGLDMALVIVYNIFYEVFGLCTSVVAEGADGHMLHARNLDFGLFLGWNMTAMTWALPDKLRPLLFNADFQRNGTTVYKGTYYAGYIGLLTGVKKNGFSISVDSRFDLKFDKGLIQWLHGDHSGNWLTFSTRSVMENNATFAEAVASLSTMKMVGPSYIIVGGAGKSEGAIITRAEDKALDVWTVESRITSENKYYVLETNYDHWKKDPFYDDRRDPANACMDQLGRNGTTFEGLYNMLSAHPNTNQLTTYTALMNPVTGELESFKQYCPHPCPIW